MIEFAVLHDGVFCWGLINASNEKTRIDLNNKDAHRKSLETLKMKIEEELATGF